MTKDVISSKEGIGEKKEDRDKTLKIWYTKQKQADRTSGGKPGICGVAESREMMWQYLMLLRIPIRRTSK